MLMCRYGKDHVHVTASSRTAASAIEGVTVHSCFGLQRGNKTVEVLMKEMGRKAKDNWAATEVVTIEEYSLIDAAFLDLLDNMGRHMKSKDVPFGGVRVILVGDIAQLPPVNDVDDHPSGSDYVVADVQYAFEARCGRMVLTSSALV